MTPSLEKKIILEKIVYTFLHGTYFYENVIDTEGG